MIKVKVNNEYKDVVKIFCGGTLQKEITKVWSREAQEYVYESSVEYTGSLPITINANGDALLDYRIYGADGGVGEQTENLFSGEFSQFNNVGGTGNTYAYFYIPEDFTLTIVAKDSHVVPHHVYLGITKDGGQNISGHTWLTYNNKNVKEGDIFTAKSSINGYHCVSMYIKSDSALLWILEHYYVMLNLGSTALPYEPYGYKLPMTVGDGNTTQNVPVYIGENQLDSVEGVADYVDKSNGKIVRRIKEYTFTGNERFGTYGEGFYLYKAFPDAYTVGIITTRFSHFSARSNVPISVLLNGNVFGDDCACFRVNTPDFLLRSTSNFTTVEECKAYFKAQYDNGTPVKMWYIMNAPVEEDPPVSLPDIPTVDGTTVIDYDGDPKPAQMYVKYRR